ncbi:MAG: hypothetical protein KIG62_06250, partial [Oscillospiraceae bacterium]|nr:hypothetical protein [Oscillospiraceae bacterium]
MNKRKAIIAAAAAALILSGCVANIDDPLYEYESDESDYFQTDEAPADGQTDPAERSGGATTLSVSGGSLGIDRRTRSQTEEMGDSGWTILVYLCGTDLESDYEAATIDLCEAISAQHSDDVHIVYQTGGTAQWSCGISNSAIQRY